MIKQSNRLTHHLPRWRFILAAIAVFSVCGFLTVAYGNNPSLAAVSPTVYLEPAVQSPVGGLCTVAIKLRNAANLYGFEAHLTFDPGQLQVQDADTNKNGVQITPAGDLFAFTPGQYYTSPVTGDKYYYKYAADVGGYFYARTEADNTAGTIDCQLTLLSPSAPASADDSGRTIATITFRTMAEQGAASIGFTNPVNGQPAVKLADSTGQPIHVLAQSVIGAVINLQPAGLTIGGILANPQAYAGQAVRLIGTYRGWEAGHGTQPVTKSDWVLQDASGAIYVTGNAFGLSYPADVGASVTVNGTVRMKDGVPYVEVPQAPVRR